MWPFKKKVKKRRLEVRKNIPPRETLWKRFRELGGIGAILLTLLFYVGIVLMDVLPLDAMNYRQGQYVSKDIRARVAFKVPSKELKKDLKQKAEITTPPVFKFNASLADEITATLRNLTSQLKATTQPANLDEALGKQFGLTKKNIMKVRKAFLAEDKLKAYERSVNQLKDLLSKTYIVRPEDLRGPNIWRSASAAIVVWDTTETPKDSSKFISLTEDRKVAQETQALLSIFDKSIQGYIRVYLSGIFEKDQPTYSFDGDRTAEDIELAKRAIEVNPPDEAFIRYEADEVLVQKSRRQPGQRAEGMSEDELDILEYEHRASLLAERKDSPWLPWLRVAGRAALLLLVTGLLCLYIAKYQPRIVQNVWRGLAIVALLLLMLGINKLIIFTPGLNPHTAVLSVMMVGVILTIAYDQRFALSIGFIMTILVTMQIRSDLAMFLVLAAGLTASVFQLREIRTRSKLLETAAITAGLVFATVWVASLAKGVPWNFALYDSAWASGFALLVGLIIQGILPLIERVFHIATSMTLLEWCDASRPLLKRLAMEAPGTYNHSLQLGAMCESAAESIGARGLLARVGAYYHDIGKVNKPAYFVENEAGSPSRHDKLSPEMSLLIIVGHVKDGLEMAREYGLPPVLHEFIATHHGTTLVQYFYHAATEQRKNGTDRAPDEVEFRYPGPKPQCKESAILMLADASESSVRAMSEPTPGRIENQVHTMVNRRLMDGQLDECELTLKEVHQIETSLIKSLCGIYHSRIAYPTPAGQKPSASEVEAEKKKQQESAGKKNQEKLEKDQA